VRPNSKFAHIAWHSFAVVLEFRSVARKAVDNVSFDISFRSSGRPDAGLIPSARGEIVIQTSKVNGPNANRRHRFQRDALSNGERCNVLLQADAFLANGCQGCSHDNHRVLIAHECQWFPRESGAVHTRTITMPFARACSRAARPQHPSDGSAAYLHQEPAVNAKQRTRRFRGCGRRERVIHVC